MKRRYLILTFAAVGGIGLFLEPLWASLVSISGATGTAGAHGANGNPGPGFSGGDGGNGESVNANSGGGFGDAEQYAEAFGGKGGAGGNGGAGGGSEVVLSASGGHGGDGGRGGDAYGNVVNNQAYTGGDVVAGAVGYGGEGGAAGSGGAGYNNVGGSAGRSGAGGDGTARAIASTSTGAATANVTAAGGGGGNDALTGGYGATIRGGSGSPDGSGFFGPIKARSGGNATVIADASNTSADPVAVTANAYGGNGAWGAPGGPGGTAPAGNGGDGGSATIQALSGSSTGGGSVSLYAYLSGGNGGTGRIGGNGASQSVFNLGSPYIASETYTTGFLALQQFASGGDGGYGVGDGYQPIGVAGSPGNGSSEIHLTGVSASSVDFTVDGRGGTGGGAYSPTMLGNGADGGSGSARLRATATGNAQGTVRAIGGAGGPGGYTLLGLSGNGGHGGPASISPSSLEAITTGKTVSLTAQQYGGAGGSGWSAQCGDGADSAIAGQVSGAAPSGYLTLRQEAFGGAGGVAPNAVSGFGGDADSTLAHTGGSELEITQTVTATGGHGGFNAGNYGARGLSGGTANASAAQSGSGKVSVYADAYGGSGGWGHTDTGGQGGYASASATGTSSGSAPVTVSAGAYGGYGGASDTDTPLDRLPGTPNVALATASGFSTGGGDVTVTAYNYGGGGAPRDFFPGEYVSGAGANAHNAVSGSTSGTLTLQQYATGGAGGAHWAGSSHGGQGGDAFAHLTSANGNPGGGPLVVYNYAYAGNQGGPIIIQNNSADATAFTDVANADDVTVYAAAYGGNGLGAATTTGIARSTNGIAFATSFGQGGSGSTLAQANAQGDILTSLESKVTSTVPAHLKATSGIGLSVVETYFSGANGFAVANGLPGVVGVLTGSPNCTAALAGHYALENVFSGASSADAQTKTVSTVLSANPATLGDSRLKLGLLSGGGSGAGFLSLQFTVQIGATTLVSQTFASTAAADAYFGDRVLDLGLASALSGGPLRIEYTLITTAPGANFDLSYIVTARGVLQQWKLTELGDANASDVGDPDGDGLLTLAEYGLVLSPGTPSQPPGAERFAYAEGERLRIFVTRDPARNDVTIEVQAADSPAGPWTSVATSTLGAPFTGPGYVDGDSATPGVRTVEVRDTVNVADAPRRFMRVWVSR